MNKILIMGLPRAGKTTLARALAPRIGAVMFNADRVRNELYTLGFSIEDRIEQARRMGWMCDRVAEAGFPVIADFVCPTDETRKAFGHAFTVFVDREPAGAGYADTNALFKPPEIYDVVVSDIGAPEFWAKSIERVWRRR
jgi:adenylylsulfate kinase-like enzyme